MIPFSEIGMIPSRVWFRTKKRNEMVPFFCSVEEKDEQDEVKLIFYLKIVISNGKWLFKSQNHN
jgi:hypothetical protein